MNSQFASDVLTGLVAKPKTLSSKYFYDKTGDAIFQEIMALEEYYLTKAEFNVLDSNKQALLDSIGKSGFFHLVEFGAGDGLKTKILLQHFLEQEADFVYEPIDISGNVLQQLEQDLKEKLPDLKVATLQGDYFEVLKGLNGHNGRKKVVLFLGSNIGNFTDDQAKDFLSKLCDSLHKGDQLLIGMDLKKDPATILEAYNDSKGVTARFNINLLERVNKELEADFAVEDFMHYPVYNPLTGFAQSYLVSKKEQTVHIAAMGQDIHFEAWEAVHTEISRKFSLSEIRELSKASGFELKENFLNDKEEFVDSLWEKV